MKKILLTICLAAASLTSFAQFYGNYDNPVTFGIKGGVNFANIFQTASGLSSSASSDRVPTFNAGVFVNFNINDKFTIQPALMYYGKGGRNKTESSITFNGDYQSRSIDNKLNLYYLHLPVNVLYNIPAGDNKFFVGAGPFLSYALSGKADLSSIENDNGEITETSGKADVEFGSGSGQVNRLDYGATITGGFKLYSGFSISANYDFGFASMQKETIPTTTITIRQKLRIIGVSIGYEF